VETVRAGITSPAAARLVNRWLLKIRKELAPWLAAQSPSGVRTSGYANTLAALTDARAAAEKGDRVGTLAALDRIDKEEEDWQTQIFRNLNRVSPEVARQERLYWYTSGDWGAAYEQKQRPVAADIFDVYRRLKDNGDVAAEVRRLRQLEDEAHAHLLEAIFVVTGKLQLAAQALKETPLP